MITNGLVRATNSMARHLALSTSAPELAALKGNNVTVSYHGVEYGGRCTGVGYTTVNGKMSGYWLTLLTPVGERKFDAKYTTVLCVGAVALPACPGFEGTGQRCTTCRVRKALHD